MTGGFLFRDQAILGLACGTLLAAGSENMSGRAFDSTYGALIIYFVVSNDESIRDRQR
jgi:hypothetical protein